MRKCNFRVFCLLIALLCMVLLSACGGAGTSGPDAPMPDDLPATLNPDEAHVILLQSAEADGDSFSVTGIVGQYDAETEAFTPSGDEEVTFSLCDTDEFHAYFWRPGVDNGSYFRTQYDGADSFFNEYYKVAVERDSFEPLVCSFTANPQGEITSLYQALRLYYEAPQDQYVSLAFSAKDADLSDAPDVVVEPDAPPYNLGGWKANNTVRWEFEVPEEGYYTVSLLYARDNEAFEMKGTINLYPEGEKDNLIVQEMGYFTATAHTAGDWSQYTSYSPIYNEQLPAGRYVLEIIPGWEDEPLPTEHFINLRDVLIYQGTRWVTLSGYEELSQEQRLEILRCDAWDVGNPWGTYSAEDIYGFLAWYTNDQYGLDITPEDVDNAITRVNETIEYDGIGEQPYSGASRFYFVCVYYELYPTQEVRENGIIDFSDEYMPFGENPLRAKDDTDPIDESYLNGPAESNPS